MHPFQADPRRSPSRSSTFLLVHTSPTARSRSSKERRWLSSFLDRAATRRWLAHDTGWLARTRELNKLLKAATCRHRRLRHRHRQCTNKCACTKGDYAAAMVMTVRRTAIRRAWWSARNNKRWLVREVDGGSRFSLSEKPFFSVKEPDQRIESTTEIHIDQWAYTRSLRFCFLLKTRFPQLEQRTVARFGGTGERCGRAVVIAGY